VTTQAPAQVQWPRWQDAAFYNQEPEVVHASIAAQRRAAPVYYYEPDGFATGFWVLSKWEHQRHVGSHPEQFSSRYGFAVGDASDPSTVLHQLPDWARARILSGTLIPAEVRGTIAHGKLSMGDENFESLIISDPPRHGLIRNIMMKALRRSLVRGQKARIAAITDEFLNAIRPGEVVDFVKTIGEIPAALMTEMIGVPAQMRAEFIDMASAQMRAITIDPNRDPDEAARINKRVAEFRQYCLDLVAQRRARGDDGGEDDLVSAIARSQHDGRPVPDGMAISFIQTFVNAGETTRSLLSFIALLLAQHPEQRHILAQRPDLVGNAIEETLRFNPLNWTGCRTATADIVLGGEQIRSGDYVVMAYASANRDEDVWERPDEYDVTRGFDKDHLGFGYGEHSCPGALLARTNAQIIIERLLARFPDWELAGAAQRWSNPFIQGMAGLPLRFAVAE
jgi:cytochrome P450